MTKNYTEEGAVDWHAQWAQHGHNFRDGFVHLDLSLYAKGVGHVIRLEPGEGFGDFSHPTTRLTLQLLARHVRGCFVVDIGCGSGVLSIASIGLGAHSGHGIDIERAVVAHTLRNVELNGMLQKITCGMPEESFVVPREIPVVIAMNMIYSEQKVAWQGVEQLHTRKAQIITSGVLVEGEQEYIAWAQTNGWKLVDRLEEEGWVAFLCNSASLSPFTPAFEFTAGFAI